MAEFSIATLVSGCLRSDVDQLRSDSVKISHDRVEKDYPKCLYTESRKRML